MSQFKSPFTEAFKVSRVLESLENYAVADSTVLDTKPMRGEKKETEPFLNDHSFWHAVLQNPEKFYGQPLSFQKFTISTWVPRVPGLYFTEKGKANRKFTEGKFEAVSDGWVHYPPPVKSFMVMGGVGTLKFAPDSEGKRIICLSNGGNASTGIPAIIDNQLFQELSLHDGVQVNIKNCVWNAMKDEWQQRFPFTSGLPRAYLCIEDASQIAIVGENHKVVYHPFSIMEYNEGNAIFFDYVYCTIDPFQPLGEYISFFENYRKNKGRDGFYLIAAEPNGELFEAKYASPKELKAYEQGSNTGLHLLEERIKQEYYKDQLLDEIIKTLGEYYTEVADIARIAGYLGIQLMPDAPARMINSLVTESLRKGKLEVLIEHAALEFPEILR
jgi:hypothetical protein